MAKADIKVLQIYLRKVTLVFSAQNNSNSDDNDDDDDNYLIQFFTVNVP
jgi:hypothetical protein